MLRRLLIALFLCTATTVIPAQEPAASAATEFPADAGLEARRAATLRMLEVLRVEEQFEANIQQVLSFVDTMIAQTPDLSPEEAEKAKQLANVAIEEAMASFSWERIRPIFVQVYAEVFTLEEINALSAFFESPHGRAFIDKQPQLMAATYREIGAILAEELPAIEARIQAIIEQAQVEPAQ